VNLNVGAPQTTEFSPFLLGRGYLNSLPLGENLCLSYKTQAFGEIGQGFTQEPPPNPLTYIRNISLLNFTQIKSPLLLDTFFDTPGQPPTFSLPKNPTLPNFNISLRGFSQDTHLNLLSQDVFFGEAGQIQSLSWPNPIILNFPFSLLSFFTQINFANLNQSSLFLLTQSSLNILGFSAYPFITLPSSLQSLGVVIVEPALVLVPSPSSIIQKTLVVTLNFDKVFITRKIELS
jgi:hypothetical protein